jgi:predicted PurR-regulated permease PerM
MPDQPRPHLPEPVFVRRLGIVLASVVATVALVMLLVTAFKLLIVVFAGVLFAVLLSGAADWLAERTPLPRGAALAIIVLSLLGAIVGFWWVVGPQVAGQVADFETALPEGLAAVEQWLRQFGWGRMILDRSTQASDMVEGGQLLGTITGAFTTTVGALFYIVIVLFIALYGAANPKLYLDNALRLVPRSKRARGREVLSALAQALRYWFLGQFVAMVAVGVLTTVGLFILGMPMALALGLLAGLLEFIPYLGPIAASVPIILIALVEGPEMAIYVGVFFLGVQQLESYVITPMAQQYAVSMPPALLIVGQIMFALFGGLLGVIFATPVLVVIVVLFQTLYVEDVLHEHAVVLGSTEDTQGESS